MRKVCKQLTLLTEKKSFLSISSEYQYTGYIQKFRRVFIQYKLRTRGIHTIVFYVPIYHLNGYLQVLNHIKQRFAIRNIEGGIYIKVTSFALKETSFSKKYIEMQLNTAINEVAKLIKKHSTDTKR